MITELFLTPIFMLVTFIIDSLPDFAFSFLNSILGGFGGFIELLSKASFIFPVPAFLTALFTVTTFYSIRFTISLVNWVIRKVPTIS